MTVEVAWTIVEGFVVVTFTFGVGAFVYGTALFVLAEDPNELSGSKEDFATFAVMVWASAGFVAVVAIALLVLWTVGHISGEITEAIGL